MFFLKVRQPWLFIHRARSALRPVVVCWVKEEKKLPFKNFFPTSLQAEKIKWGSQLRTYFLPSPRSPVRIKGSPWPDIEKERLDTVRALSPVVKRLETHPKVPSEVPFFPTWGRGTGWIWSTNWLGSPGTHLYPTPWRATGPHLLSPGRGDSPLPAVSKVSTINPLTPRPTGFLELFLSCLRCWFFTWLYNVHSDTSYLILENFCCRYSPVDLTTL